MVDDGCQSRDLLVDRMTMCGLSKELYTFELWSSELPRVHPNDRYISVQITLGV
jgi:hypothetical protein